MAKLRGSSKGRQRVRNKMLDMAIEFLKEGELELVEAVLKSLKEELE